MAYGPGLNKDNGFHVKKCSGCELRCLAGSNSFKVSWCLLMWDSKLCEVLPISSLLHEHVLL